MRGPPRAPAACSSLLSSRLAPSRLDVPAPAALRPPSLSLPRSVRGFPTPLGLPSAAPPRSRAVSPAPFLRPLTHRSRNRDPPCFPGSPVLGKLLPPRAPRRAAPLRAPGRLEASRAPGRGVGSAPPSSPPRVWVLGREPSLCALTPCRPCRACARRPGPPRSRGFKNWRAGRAPWDWLSAAAPPSRTLGPVRLRRGEVPGGGSTSSAGRHRGRVKID